jgi:hypothetical protein
MTIPSRPVLVAILFFSCITSASPRPESPKKPDEFFAIDLTKGNASDVLPKPYERWIKQHQAFVREVGGLKGTETCTPNAAWKPTGTNVVWLVALKCTEFQVQSVYPILGILEKGSKSPSTFDFNEGGNWQRFWRQTNAPQIEAVTHQGEKLQIKVKTPSYEGDTASHYALQWTEGTFKGIGP